MGRPTMTYAVMESGGPLVPFAYDRRDPGPDDIEIKIAYAGCCHSDIHICCEEWAFDGKKTSFPVVPGHEITGRVKRVGSEVTAFSPGDRVGVGVIVESCGDCAECLNNLECYCANKLTFTYNDVDRTGEPTRGGYATHVVVHWKFVLRIPDNLSLDVAAPLLCAGVTVWSPIVHWNMGEGHRVAVAGLGGLGHMAVQIAAAKGCEVVVLSRSLAKAESAKKLGAAAIINTSDQSAMMEAALSCHFVIDTVSASQDMKVLLGLLKLDGVLVKVGLPDGPMTINAGTLAGKRRSIAGSQIGGIQETQEMLEFCAERSIAPWIERIHMNYINEAWARMRKGDVKYRFVVDITTSPSMRPSLANEVVNSSAIAVETPVDTGARCSIV